MKIPPSPEKAAPAAAATSSERDRSFLLFAGLVLVAIALGFKSELLAEGQVWALALGLVVLAAPALLGYLRGTAEFPRIEHYIPVALGAITLAGLAGGHDSAGHPLIPELWKYGLITAAFGVGFILSARLDYLRLRDAEKRGHIVLQEAILVLVPELWKYGLITAAFGVGFILSARLDYLRLRDAEKRGHIVLQEAILVLVLA